MFHKWYEKREAEIRGWMTSLHRHPELAFEEHRTAEFVAARLAAWGLEVTTGIGGTGVVGLLRGACRPVAGPVRTIGLRAELDALPMREQADVGYRSQVEGKFHGCGHDGHSVTLLAAAGYLAAHNDFAGDALFVFQPAEETLRGAQAMIADGLFTRFACDEIYALHNLPGLPAGHVAAVPGGALASCDEVLVRVSAKGTHGSAPHTGADGVLAAAAFLTGLQQTLSRVLDSRESGVVSFGRIAGGAAGNVLPELVEIEGTMRSHAVEAREVMAGQLQALARSVEIAHGVKVDVSVEAKAPAAINHDIGIAGVTASAMRVVGASRIVSVPKPIMAADDFAFMLQQVPGAFFFVGQDGPYCHHPEYVFDSNVIPIGAAMFADLVRSRTAVAPET